MRLLERVPRAFDPIIAVLFGVLVCGLTKRVAAALSPRKPSRSAYTAASPPEEPDPPASPPKVPTAPAARAGPLASSAAPSHVPAASAPTEKPGPARGPPKLAPLQVQPSPASPPIAVRPEAGRYSELCDQSCRGSPGADGLAPAAWIESQPEEERASEVRWQTRLTAEQFRVLRMKGTEPIHSGRYNELFEAGAYECVGCGLALYSSKHKFKTGHGWPAFGDNLPEALTRVMHGRKVEIVCAGCAGHVGHVFKSSRYPPPKRERHCVNSTSLRFVPV